MSNSVGLKNLEKDIIGPSRRNKIIEDIHSGLKLCDIVKKYNIPYHEYYGLNINYKTEIIKFWESLDWTKDDSDLASQINKNIVTVGLWRQQLKKPISPKFWKSVDWNLTTNELSKQLGYFRGTISKWRRLVGFKSNANIIFWKSLDWNLTNIELAHIVNRRKNTVCYWRGKVGFKLPSHRRKTYDWDWNLTYNELAKKHGVSRQRVYQVAIMLGVKAKSFIEKNREFWEAQDWALYNKQLVEKLKVCTETISKMRRKYGKPVGISEAKARTVEKFKNVDWSKSNHEIAKQLGLGYHYIYCVRNNIDNRYSHITPKGKQ